jgi:hypothetical protein
MPDEGSASVVSVPADIEEPTSAADLQIILAADAWPPGAKPPG